VGTVVPPRDTWAAHYVELWRTIDAYGRVISMRIRPKVLLTTDNLAAERLPTDRAA